MSASVQTNPPSIKLSWPGDANAVDYTISRRQRDDAVWGTALGLSGEAEEYLDTNVALGGSYEYRLRKTGNGYLGYGYIYAGISLPLVEVRGRVILLVERSQAREMAVELARHEQDLVGDGWIVSRLEVDATNTAAQVKAEVLVKCSADPGEYKTLFIFGRVPVPYSGEIAPDGHGDHVGAWPADVFYGDLDGGWTDTMVNKASAADTRNRNVPGDGKFDASSLPSDVDLEVGRVDLGNLPAFGVSEQQLLRRYLRKAHAFRFGRLAAERWGLVDDKFGVNNGEAFAVNGWRNFSAMFGAAGVVPASWSTLTTQSFLWAYGCGPGTYTSAGGVTTTPSLAATDPKAVFTMLFGSYFGDWDSRDNLMRAALGTPNYTLACVWAGRPNFQF
ncbi:MAG TPA: fibronectin type III domain-containing protein, partial [Clostridia bacterium]|nr:fibronectin type III domain-containing protein [Clostridia bacterium]